MRVIPVIDLLNRRAVHAVKGDRDHYKPIQSVLSESSDPLQLAAAFRDRLDLRELYIADLDAIRDSDRIHHRNLIENLLSRNEFHVILDAGICDSAGAIDWLKSGVYKVILGSETMESLEVLQEIASTVDPVNLIFSMDLYGGIILSKCPQLAALSPMRALDRIQSFGLQEIILLEMDRVGSRSGVNVSFAADAALEFPDCTLIVGGGIRSLDEIMELRSLGIEGVLVATVLHRGIIGRHQLADLQS